MKKVGVIANPKRPHADDVFDRLARKADELNWDLFADPASSRLIPSATPVEFDQIASTVDVLLSMGGDGTVLFCARLLNDSSVPILGINLGSLGFLTGVSEDRMDSALDALAQGRCSRETRSVAQCTTSAGKTCRALNEAVIGFGGSSHIVTLELAVNGTPATSYSCDGLIVCTPTGSTGHSLSTGGPILHPGCGAFGISVICPHTLSNRPLVVPDSSPIDVTVHNSRKTLLLSVDGQDTEELSTGEIVRITRSSTPAIFLYPPDYSYYSVLRRKLHWRGSTI